ncbi:MAG: type II toxin-antitoxin system RelE/ParE family toxin [Spirochaetes bacterium]|nr:type II toxin-antitoxin system RelE/ParE family toxin [Spirochaetota bacterium]
MVNWSDNSKKQLASIFAYISEDSKVYALKMINNITDQVKKLDNFPEMGNVVSEFNDENIREIHFAPYRIVYLVRSDGVTILAVIHSKQNMRNDIINLTTT